MQPILSAERILVRGCKTLPSCEGAVLCKHPVGELTVFYISADVLDYVWNTC